MAKKRLTTLEKNEIGALFNGGQSVAKIAEKYGRSKVTIYRVTEHLNRSRVRTKVIPLRLHPLELEALDAAFEKYGVQNRTRGIRKLLRSAGDFFEERDDIAAEWKAIRIQLDGIANNLNQIARACNSGKVDMSGELPDECKKLSRKYYELSDILSHPFVAVNRQSMVDNHLENVLVKR